MEYGLPVYVYSYPNRPYNVLGYMNVTTSSMHQRGLIALATGGPEALALKSAPKRAQEIGADALIVMNQGEVYAGATSISSAFTTGNFYGAGFNATTTGTTLSKPLFRGRASIILIKWKA
jgi:hypothetical protein